MISVIFVNKYWQHKLKTFIIVELGVKKSKRVLEANA
jgi:hypothetical protein